MESFRKILLFPFFLLLQLTVSGQDISGYVYDAKDSTALGAVSVYYDGTSIGTVTNNNGFFEIKKTRSLSTALVISYIGYETIIITNATTPLPNIYLQQKEESLDEVYLTPDSWSREKKMAIFKREFLGTSKEAGKCEIQNEESIKLYYNPTTRIMVAEATEPLVIKNKHLGYEVRYNLVDFSVEFDLNSAYDRISYVYYAGTSFFKELRPKVRRRHFKNRKEAYDGSRLHFMRSLAKKKLWENNFRIFYKSFEVPPYKYFEIEPLEKQTKISLTTDKISILYKDFNQSNLQTKHPFFIDEFGNHSPPDFVAFGGDMTRKRMSHMLPLDYYPEKD